MTEDEQSREARRMQRRDLLKKSAVVGAAAWAAPTIVSSTAHATHGGTCPDDACTYYYAFKLEGTGCTDIGGGNSNCLTGGLCAAAGGNQVFAQCWATGVSGGSNSTNAQFTLPPGFSVVAAIAKKGSGNSNNGFDKCTSLPASFTHTTVGGNDCHKRYSVTWVTDWSHLEILVCGPTAPSTSQTYC